MSYSMLNKNIRLKIINIFLFVINAILVFFGKIIFELTRTISTSGDSIKICGIIWVMISLAGCVDNTINGTFQSTTVLEGVWSSNCVPIGGSQALVFKLYASHNNISSTIFLFNDTTCNQIGYITAVTGVSDVGALIGVSSGIGKAYLIDITNKTTAITPKSTAITALFNSSVECGDSDWIINVAKDISTKTCALTGTVATPESILYTLFQVDNTSTPNILYFSDLAIANGTTPALRPTDIDTNLAYFRE